MIVGGWWLDTATSDGCQVEDRSAFDELCCCLVVTGCKLACSWNQWSGTLVRDVIAFDAQMITVSWLKNQQCPTKMVNSTTAIKWSSGQWPGELCTCLSRGTLWRFLPEVGLNKASQDAGEQKERPWVWWFYIAVQYNRYSFLDSGW